MSYRTRMYCVDCKTDLTGDSRESVNGINFTCDRGHTNQVNVVTETDYDAYALAYDSDTDTDYDAHALAHGQDQTAATCTAMVGDA